MAKEEVKFEDKLNSLEKMVNELEKGDVDLDDAINKYTNAMKLAKECSDSLKSAEENVNKILTENGEEDFKVEENIGKIRPVTAMLDNGHTPEEMLREVLEGLDVEFTDTLPAAFSCNCSKQRIEKAIISIGKKEIQSLIDEGKDIEVKCHFCNTAYNYSVDELKELLKKSR